MMRKRPLMCSRRRIARRGCLGVGPRWIISRISRGQCGPLLLLHLNMTNAGRRVRYQVSSASPLNYSAECSKLAEMIKMYSME